VSLLVLAICRAGPGGNSVNPNNGTWFVVANGPLTFVMLNSELAVDPSSPQYAFLEATLSAVDRTVTPWVIVAFHRPMYYSGEWLRLLAVCCWLQQSWAGGLVRLDQQQRCDLGRRRSARLRCLSRRCIPSILGRVCGAPFSSVCRHPGPQLCPV